MPISKRTGRAVLTAALLSSTAAHADVTAEQVWADWREYLALGGEDSLTVGSESTSNGTLIVNDVTLSVSDPDTDAVVTLDKITFTEAGDGTVTVAMSDSYPITVTTAPEGEGPVSIEMSVVQEGMTIVASGTPEAITYDVTADSYGLVIDSVTPTDQMTLNEARFVLQGVEGSYTSREGELRRIESTMGAETLEIAVDAAEPAGDGFFTFAGTIDGLTTETTAALPMEMDTQSPETMFVEGFSVEADYSTGATDYSFSFSDGANTGEGTGGSASGEMAFSMDRTQMSYSGSAQEPRLSLSAATMPFPVELTMAEYGYDLTVPLAATEEPADFGLRLSLTDLTVNDAVWSLFDPQGALPRDPATLALDLSGTGRLFFDAMDPEQAQAMTEAEVPGEIHSLTLEDFTLRAAGVEATGEGAFTFDNTDLETFGGFPAPTGSASLRVSGANALIDDLIAMGVLPQEQAMGARMMLGLFASPVGDDQLESTIEITEEGQIFANGQRLQ